MSRSFTIASIRLMAPSARTAWVRRSSRVTSATALVRTSPSIRSISRCSSASSALAMSMRAVSSSDSSRAMTSPFFTVCPSSNSRLTIFSVTLAEISTDSVARRFPTERVVSVKGRSAT